MVATVALLTGPVLELEGTPEDEDKISHPRISIPRSELRSLSGWTSTGLYEVLSALLPLLHPTSLSPHSAADSLRGKKARIGKQVLAAPQLLRITLYLLF